MSVATEQINQRAYVSSKKSVSLSSLSDGAMSASPENLRRPNTQCSSQNDYPDRNSDPDSSRKPGTSLMWKSLLCLACGLVFGVSMHKAHSKCGICVSHIRVYDHRSSWIETGKQRFPMCVRAVPTSERLMILKEIVMYANISTCRHWLVV